MRSSCFDCGNLACIVVLMISVVVTQNVEFTGNPKVNGTYGGNVTITWNVKSKLKVNEDMFLNICVGDIYHTECEIILKQDITSLAQQERNFDRSKKSSLEIVKRVSAKYSSDGKKDSNGRIIGKVLFTFTNLTFSDSGWYTIAEGFNKKYNTIFNRTVLDVFSPPVPVDKKIKSEYQIVNGKGFTLSLDFLGKPKPIVTWTLGSSVIASEPGKKTIGDHIYKYTVTLDGNKLPEACENKTLSYSATNDIGNVTGSTVIQVTEKLRISGWICAGYITVLEIGVILISVCIYICYVRGIASKYWKQLAGFLAVVGVAFIIRVAIGYALIYSSIVENRKCKESFHILEKCNIAISVFGVIDFIVLMVSTQGVKIKCKR